MGGGAAGGSSLDVTPSWATAATCVVVVVVSVFIQRTIHYAGVWLKRRDYESMKDAFDKIKEELMLLGVISLLLAVLQPFTTEICIPSRIILTLVPCKLVPTVSSSPLNPDSHCGKKNKVSILGANDIHDIHMFIFMLAMVHVFYSLITIFLGNRRIKAWGRWELELQTTREPDFLEKQEAKFVRRRLSANKSEFIRVLVAFSMQFVYTVTKDDYVTLRRAFIYKHGASDDYNFHSFLNKSIAQDFKTVVGISEYFWIVVIAFFFLNVYGWYTFFWFSFLPILLLLILGAKLQYILGKIAREKAQHNGADVKVEDNIFWFSSARILLHLLHLTLFENAFELALLFWIWATFGVNSCLLDNKSSPILHLVSGVIIQIQCTYMTLPLYALVSQLDSDEKRKLFGEQSAAAVQETAAC